MTRIVIHADDVGFCQGANDAFLELSALGTISAGSVMVPCPWFQDLVLRVAEDPNRYDVGVHLTLTSEHDGYRWAPLTRPSPAAGLTDADGYMWARVADVRANAHPDAVESEWRAQIERALGAGLDVTHFDAHMGAALAPEWCDRYVALGVEYGVPVLLTPEIGAYGPNKHLRGADESVYAAAVEQARAAGMPVFDVVLETDFRRERGAPVDYGSLLSSARADLVYAALHPCSPGPGEVERIDPEWWHVRTDEYELFRTEEWVTWLADGLTGDGFEVLSMRTLRAELRGL